MSCCGRGWRSPALWPAGGCADGRRDLAGDGSSLWREACLHDLGRGSILVLRCPAPGRAATRETCRPTRPETGAERCRAARCHPPRPGPLAMDRRGAPQGLGPPAGDRRHPGQPDRVLRIMGENHLLSPHRRSPRPANDHDGAITTEAPNVMWGADGAVIPTVEDGNVTLFIVAKHWNAEGLGWHVARHGNRYAAAEALALAVSRVFGSVGADAARSVSLRHDHGSPFMSEHFQNQLKFFGMTPSFAFVREPETNGVAERFIRTLKEQIVFGRIYRTS